MADHTIAWERFDDWINKCIELSATDMHLVPGYKPMGRVKGELEPIDDLVLTREMTHWVAVSLHGNASMYDGGPGYLHSSRTYGRTLADITTARAGGAKTIAVRFHGGKIPTLDEANLPGNTTELLKPGRGIVLVSGPHGSGKTTSLYAMTDWINRNQAVHICTIEKPRWYLLQPARALVQQREVGLDGASFSELLTVSLRQAPNVLMLGEVEDFETLAGILLAGETGHLVLVQIHAKDAAEAVQRFIDAAPEGMQEQVKRQLRDTLRGVTNQRLVRKTCAECGGKGCEACDQTGYRGRVAVYDVIGEGARKFIDGETPDTGFYLGRARDQVKQLEDAGTIGKEEADRMRRELGV